jgi:conjugative transfer signal peptidase TraF
VLKPKTFTKAGRNRAVVSAAVVLPAMIAGLLPVCGIRINTSYSLPMGIYVRTSDPRAGLIEFCPEGRFAAESSARGYRTPGFYPDGAVPLLKPVVAQPGDTVEMSAAGIAVNGRLLAQTAPVAKDRRGRLLNLMLRASTPSPKAPSGWRRRTTEGPTTAATWVRFRRT